MTTIDDTLSALADPTRRLAVDVLARGPRSAGDLAEAAGASPPAMSRHLKVLRRCGLVEPAYDPEDARRRIYSLRPQRLDEVQGWLRGLEASWSEQLEAFADHLEAR
jgi:DNA-binding transcriptional ArsR family regulator